VLKSEKFLDVRIVKSRRKIKNAMVGLMSSHSYSDITINDIVTKAQVNRGTFYNHFDNKDELLNEIMDEIVSELLDAYRLPYLHIKTFQLNEIAPKIVFFQNVYKHKEFYRMIVHSERMYLFHTKLTRALTSLSMNELGLQHLKINREIYSGYSAHAIAGMIIDWVDKGFVYSPEYMAEQLMEFITMQPTQSLVALKNK